MPERGRTFHFLSGLPRSGSTLTAALLRQNPRFHAGMSSPVAALFEGLIAQVSAGTELSTMVDDEQRARLLRGLFDGYYADRPEPVIFDTNRAIRFKDAHRNTSCLQVHRARKTGHPRTHNDNWFLTRPRTFHRR